MSGGKSIIIVMVATAACMGCMSAPATAESCGGAACAPGQVCRNNACIQLCATNTECPDESPYCVEGECSGQVAGCSEDNDCSTPGACEVAQNARCVARQCIYEETFCEPPADACLPDGVTLRVYAEAGRCNPFNLECEYSPVDIVCPDGGCFDGACVQCTRDSQCNAPPAGGCQPDGVSLHSYDREGKCNAQNRCEYTPQETECTEAGCFDGACLSCTEHSQCNDNDPCTVDRCEPDNTCSSIVGNDGAQCADGNACTTAGQCSNGDCIAQALFACETPPGECFGGVGQCNPATGLCAYPELSGACTPDELPCTYDVCDGGVCTHPSVSSVIACEDLILDGSFEPLSPAPIYYAPPISSGDSLMAWEVGQGSVDWIGSLWSPSHGQRSIDLNGYSVGSIFQDIPTVVGQRYVVTFDMAGNPLTNADTKTMIVFADSEQQAYIFDGAGFTTNNMGWQTHTFTFEATNTTTRLEFRSTHSSDRHRGPTLDNVRLYPDF